MCIQSTINLQSLYVHYIVTIHPHSNVRTITCSFRRPIAVSRQRIVTSRQHIAAHRQPIVMSIQHCSIQTATCSAQAANCIFTLHSLYKNSTSTLQSVCEAQRNTNFPIHTPTPYSLYALYIRTDDQLTITICFCNDGNAFYNRYNNVRTQWSC